MRKPTLLAQLLKVQTLSVALSCTLLVAGAIAGSALLLRHDQDQWLATTAGALCRSLAEERSRDQTGVHEAAERKFHDAAQTGYRYELVNREGAVSISAGEELTGWVPPSSGKIGCSTTGRVLISALEENTYRSCETVCDEEFRVRIITDDVLARPEVEHFAWVLMGALPIAMLAGAWAGRVLFEKRLRPLQEIEIAASRLEARPGVTLGVGAEAAELAGLESAFDNLLARLGEAWAREKRFTQEASHEFRTPLTVLRARLERLYNDAGADAGLAREVESAIGEIAALDRLVEALLLLARSDSAPLPSAPVNLCDLAREVAHRQALADGPTGRTPEVEAPDEILVRGSEELLARALGNLVENSRKFGGHAARIRIRVSQEDGRGVVTVEDDGPGIPPEYRPLVFDRFYRGPSDRNRVPGSGLGLAVVEAIVRRHGGDVRTGAASLGGEEVRISLPVLR